MHSFTVFLSIFGMSRTSSFYLPFSSIGIRRFQHTVDGRNPAPVDMVNIQLFEGFYASQVVQDFFHLQYLLFFWFWCFMSSLLWFHHLSCRLLPDLRLQVKVKEPPKPKSVRKGPSGDSNAGRSCHIPLYKPSPPKKETPRPFLLGSLFC